MKWLKKLTFLLIVGGFILTAQAQQPTRGGTAVFGLIQEPAQLNRFVGGQSGSTLSVLTVEPLFTPAADGTYRPVLAAEVPTRENGGLSEDFLTVIYRLKEGLTWSDGEPFTAEDIVFTWEAYNNPESLPAGSAITPAYDLIESVTAVNPLTVRVRMKDINPGYLDLWQAVLPEHKFDSTVVTTEHPQARLSLGTGPFAIAEWRAGERITFERNPNYRDSEKPYLDRIVVQIVPDAQVALSSFTNGEFDFVYFFTSNEYAALADAEASGNDIRLIIEEGEGLDVEWLWLNHSDGGAPDRPHPVLGNSAIREAMDYGIDRQAIVDQILEGYGTLTGSLIYSGWAAVDRPATPYDPERANRILDEAGWVRGPDGIRTKDGIRASLRYQTISGDPVRELYQQLIQQNMLDIGIELVIQNAESSVLLSRWDGALWRGDYDLFMSRGGYVIDPMDRTLQFTSSEVPTETYNGLNFIRYQSPEFDRLVQEAASTLDRDVRKPLYEQADAVWAQDRSSLPLYRTAKGTATTERLQGVNLDHWQDPVLHSAADLYLESTP